MNWCPPSVVLAPAPVYWGPYWWDYSPSYYGGISYVNYETTVIREVPVEVPVQVPVYAALPGVNAAENTPASSTAQPAGSSESLSFPDAKINIMYRDVSRSVTVRNILSNPPARPAAWQKQIFTPGPIVQWECNPLIPGRDAYEFWVTDERTGLAEKMDIIYYGEMTVVWSDSDLLITIE